ncbi:MAG: RNA polymerase sigma factor [Chitinophagales bacterium]
MVKENFKTAIIELKSAILPYAIKLTGNQHDAEDLLQETVLKALKNEDKYRRDTNLKAWLLVIMRNLFVNEYRKKKKRNTILDKSANNYLIDSGHLTVSNKANSNFILEDIWKAIREIPSKLAEPFLMMCDGFKYQEIAEATGVPLGTVKSRIFLARQRLSKSLVTYRYR